MSKNNKNNTNDLQDFKQDLKERKVVNAKIISRDDKQETSII